MSRQAGLHVRETRVPRSTGTPVLCIDALHPDDTDFKLDAEEGAGRWVTFCEAHGTFVHHTSWRTARSFLSAPEEWCDGCKEVVENGDGPEQPEDEPFTEEERARALETRRRKAEEAEAEREREAEAKEQANEAAVELQIWSVRKPLVPAVWLDDEKEDAQRAKDGVMKARADAREARTARRILEEEIEDLGKKSKRLPEAKADLADAEARLGVAARDEQIESFVRDRLARRAFLRGCIRAGFPLYREGDRWLVGGFPPHMSPAPVPRGFLPTTDLQELMEKERREVAA
jgi:hypothetical protein